MIYPQVKTILENIDDKFFTTKKKGESRYSINWGRWSRIINIEMKPLMEGDSELAQQFRYVYMYWINRSQLLELYFKSKYGKSTQKHKRNKEAKLILQIIQGKKVPEDYQKWFHKKGLR